ncbi:hypothetical protein HD806DRAFT_483842 [Xylariaceae sp. AK1471]|nr:hypothetical protein HD806DRAFT_483842 [Xylariaceae sp. AK1471]
MESARDIALRTLGNPTYTTSIHKVGAVNGDEGRQQWQPEETTAYLLKWTAAEITQTRINSAIQLRTHILDDGGTARHLFVFHGLPADYVIALKDMLDIDPSFFEAHVGRRSYRPMRKKTKATWAQYDYPELVKRYSVSPVVDDDRQQEAVSPDVVGDPPSHMTSTAGDSVMLCRASIWLSDKAHVLFLDRPAWANSTLGVSRGQYKAYTLEKIPDKNGITKIVQHTDANGNTTTLGDEIPSLDTMLYENLRDGCVVREDLLELLEELIIGQWGDFFESLSCLDLSSIETTALFWQTSDCLERNLDVSRQRDKIRRKCVDSGAGPDIHPRPEKELQSTTAEWEALLSRVNRRAQLLSHLSPAVATVQMPNAEKDADADASMGISSGHRGDKHNSNKTSASPADKHQRSLDRVTYLGGVLLPFSIVSGILGIDEPYGPGGSLFWIFWAVTVPLAFVTLGVIYADSIRRNQVWQLKPPLGSDSDSTLRIGNKLHVPARVSTPDLEQAVPHNLSVPIPISNRIAETVAIYPENADEADETEEEDGDGEEGEPDMIVEKRWMNPSGPRAAAGDGGDGREWRKEELGWMGACATLFQVYKLKKGVPPGHRHRHSNYKRSGPGPRRAKTG